jgi:hypothetical protein
MKRPPGFAEGAVLALLLSASGAALFVMFSPFIAPGCICCGVHASASAG